MAQEINKDLVADPRSVDELFAATLVGNYEDDAAWDAVRTLRLKGTPEVFELAKKNVTSESPKARGRALNVLGQLGAGKPDSERPFLEESIAIAIRMTMDSDPLVASQAAWALGHLGGAEAQATLIALRKSPDSSTRHAVAFGLHGAEGQEAIETLIQLMEDNADEVRDWATFALGATPKNDSAAIRAALRARLKDSYANAQDEAIWGLALRQDRVGLELLLERLNAEDWKPGDEEAAEEILDLRGDPPVEQLRAGLRTLLAK